MSILSGIVSGIVSTVCGAISSGVLTIAAAVSLVGAIIDICCKLLGIGKPEMEPEEFGDKAIQAEEAGITPDQYEDYKDYIKAVEEFEVDPEKSKLTTREEKLEKAAEVGLHGIGGVDSNNPFLTFAELAAGNIAPFLNLPGRMDGLLKVIMADGKGFDVSAISTLAGYYNGIKDHKNTEKALDILTSVEKLIDPKISDREALNRVLNS